jgi:Outer membrane protein beta-barrel domain
MKKFLILLAASGILVTVSSPAFGEMTGWIAGVMAGVQPGSGMVGGQVGYFFPHVGLQLDVGHAFNVAKEGTVSATMVLGNLVLTVPLDPSRTVYLYATGGGGIVYFDGSNLPPFGSSVTDRAVAYGGGIGTAVFLHPSIAMMAELRVIGFGHLSRLSIDEHNLSRLTLGIAYRF